MAFRRWKYLLSMVLLSGLLVGTGTNVLAADVFSGPGQKPFYSMTVTVSADQRETFFAGIEKFAYDSGFADRIELRGTEHVLITMWREDLKIYARNPFDRSEYRFHFYKNCGYPEIESHFFEFWIGELKKAISQVPGAEFSDEGPRE